MNQKTVLSFSPLESYTDFLRNEQNVNKVGVYVWGFRFVNTKTAMVSDFTPYYVGKHQRNIHQRIQEHVREIRQGTHKIISMGLLDNPQYYPSQDPAHLAYLNTGCKKSDLDDEERVALIPHVDAYLDNLFVTYLGINHLSLSEDEAAQFVNRLEKYVQQIIGVEKIAARIGQIFPEDFCPKIVADNDTQCLLSNYPHKCSKA